MILRVIHRSCLRLRCPSTAVACSVRIVLLRVNGDVCINCNSRVLDIVDVLVLLAAGAAALVCERVLHAGALPLTVHLACDCRLLRSLIFLVI